MIGKQGLRPTIYRPEMRGPQGPVQRPASLDEDDDYVGQLVTLISVSFVCFRSLAHPAVAEI